MKLISRYVQYIGIGILFLFLQFWDQVTKFAPSLDDKDLLSVLVIVIGAFLLHYDNILEKLTNREESLHNLDNILESLTNHEESLYNLTISDAFSKISQLKSGKITNLRIYAITTEVMLPIFRGLNIQVETCQILIHKFPNRSHCKHAKELNKTVGNIVEKWRELQISGKIKNLEIAYYTEMPCNYVVLVDLDLMLTGCYSPNDESVHGNDFKEPYLFVATSKSEKDILNKNILWFDSYYSYWRNTSTI